MDLDQFDGSNYLGKTDLPPEGATLTIASFSMADMRDGTKKLCISWRESTAKPMLVNKTNLRRLKNIFGTSDSNAMLGKRIRVANDPNVEFGGVPVGGLRIYALPKPAANAEPAEPAAPAAAPGTARPGPDPELRARLNDDIPF